MTEYELEPTIHYTDAEKIKRLTAWHESEKAEIATLRAEVEKLKGEKSDLQHDIDYMIAQNVESIQAVMTQYDKALGTVKRQAAQIATLEYIVETYAVHNAGCDILHGMELKCSCGYDNSVKGYFKQYAVENDDYDYSTQKNFD